MIPLRAIVADDSVVIRQGVARILAEGGFQVTAEARDADELLDAVAAEPPHLAVVDIRMPPGGNAGLAAAITIRERFPTVGVLVLSQFLEPEYALRLLGAGVDRVGYLLKDRLGEAAELLDAARRVAGGGSAVDPAVISELVRARRRDDRLTRLTAREREALGLIAEGHSNRAIATRLGITTKTLEGMSGTIFAKLGLEDDPDLNRRVLAVLLYLDGAG
jgi:DNA-binding NarL/FixJ family response regulator